MRKARIAACCIFAFTTRTHVAPHFAQAPSALVPARMHGSTNRSGNVAKWAADTPCVGMVQTLRRLA